MPPWELVARGLVNLQHSKAERLFCVTIAVVVRYDELVPEVAPLAVVVIANSSNKMNSTEVHILPLQMALGSRNVIEARGIAWNKH